MKTNQSKLHEKLSDLAVNDATIYAHLKVHDNSGMPDLDVAIALIRLLIHEKNSYFEQAKKLMETDVRPMVVPKEVIFKTNLLATYKTVYAGSAMTPTGQDKELREEMLSLYSANFNDGEPIEGRVGSRDMFSVSVIVDFVDDFIIPFIIADRKRVESEAKIEAAEHIQYTMVKPACGYYYEILSGAILEYITELRAQQEEL